MWKLSVAIGNQELGTYDVAVGAEFVVGRDPTVDIVVGERSVSRRHCRLTGQQDGVAIEDLESANGIFVAGRQVKQATLRSGDEAQLGMVQLRVSRMIGRTGMIPMEGLLETMVRDSDSSSSILSMPKRLDTGQSAYQSLERERLALLIEAGKSLSSHLDLDELIERILDHLFQILPVRRAVLALQEKSGELTARSVRPALEARELSQVCSQHIIREVIESGRPRIIEDASLDQRFNMAQSILAANIKAAICAPLISQTRAIGALYADFPGRARLYSPSDLEFFGAFASLCAVALENSRMQAELRERERLQRDLEIAAAIQKSLLPDESFEIPGIEVDWAYWPARQVGGDFYDCVAVDGHRLALLLGDVSGKSIGAALFMARLVSFLRATIPENPAPGPVLTRTNALLGTREDQVLFATACYLLIDPAKHTLRYASAGHLPALILEPSTNDFRELKPTGIPLGIQSDYVYAGHDEQVLPGSIVLLYTDGIVEARDAQGSMFGADRVKALLLENRSASPREITLALIAAVRLHCRDSPFLRDDIALLVARIE